MTASAPIAVLGPGSLGALLARLVAQGDQPVAWWGGERAPVVERRAKRRGERDAGGKLPPDVLRCATPEEALGEAALVFLAVPAGALPDLARRLGARLSPDRLVVHAAKGLEGASGRRPSEILAAETAARRLGALGGPYLVAEVLGGYATTLVVASRFDEVHQAVHTALASDRIRLERTHDVVGVELAGAAVVALGAAAGLCAGLRLGSGARAVLLARAQVEATRLGLASGAAAETFGGPAGLADLLVVSADTEGLGYRFGRRVGAGEPADAVREEAESRTEALRALDGLQALARRLAVRAPTLEALREILVGNAVPAATIDELLRAGS
ncbi:MAG: NAD(P)-binding domain-containing protein [Deltaproteobacteria bacterium]|nr:NAD(P)-binding domain-containing protein [Deltaproteobacteria bacterium]